MRQYVMETDSSVPVGVSSVDRRASADEAHPVDQGGWALTVECRPPALMTTAASYTVTVPVALPWVYARTLLRLCVKL